MAIADLSRKLPSSIKLTVADQSGVNWENKSAKSRESRS